MWNWLKRLPIVRHIRYWRTIKALNDHYDAWLAAGYRPVHADHDYAQAEKIWRGEA